MTDILDSPELKKGEFKDTLKFLNEDLQLLLDKRILKIFGSWRYKHTNEKMKYSLKYFERQYQPLLLELFEKKDFASIVALPSGEYGGCATQLECRWVESGELICVQVVEARPHEGGRYVGLTPARVFQGERGKAIVKYIAKMER